MCGGRVESVVGPREAGLTRWHPCVADCSDAARPPAPAHPLSYGGALAFARAHPAVVDHPAFTAALAHLDIGGHPPGFAPVKHMPALRVLVTNTR